MFYVAFCSAYSVFYYFNVIFSGLIVGEERDLFLIHLLTLLWFPFEEYPLPPGAKEGLHCFIVALPGPSI